MLGDQHVKPLDPKLVFKANQRLVKENRSLREEGTTLRREIERLDGAIKVFIEQMKR